MKLSIKKYLPYVAYLLCSSLATIILFTALATATHKIIWVPKAKRAAVARILNS